MILIPLKSLWRHLKVYGILSRPLYKFNFEPVGVGDLIAGTFLAHY